jgi:hypothetical protein
VCDAILVERETYMAGPRVGEKVGGHHAMTALQQEVQPDDLQIEIVVRQHLRWHGVVEREPERTGLALVRPAQRAADILSEPAGANPRREVVDGKRGATCARGGGA